jgi:ech hydrogenase subunit A
MVPFIVSLFILPVAVSALLLVLPKSAAKIVTILATLVLTGISLYLYFSVGNQPVQFRAPDITDNVVLWADFLLLAYILYQGLRQKNILVWLLAALQAGILIYVSMKMPHLNQAQFHVDKLSLFMFILVNIVSGIIAIYSLKYIDEEHCSTFRKKYFLSTIFWFVGAMNLLAAADNLEYFYLFFELTTLASYLLIRFRLNEESKRNALTALWMNQVGGLAILGAICYVVFSSSYGTPAFSDILSKGASVGLLLPFAFLAIAALVKGAQYPFNKWLIGAMVAPTPVSALLHSSTMVKIAPFLMLKISPIIKGTPLATVIIGLTAFVFIAAAIGALSQNTFKKILAHSTIALLALMILMAAVGTPIAITAALMLILFHGLSKCMLFLNAGVMEHVFHVKETSSMTKLGEMAPYTILIAVMGFMSLLLPPFGAFVGKWFTIETLGTMSHEEITPIYKLIDALLIIMIACGSAVLSLLYFKVLGAMISRTGERDKIKFEKLHSIYRVSLNVLFIAVLLVIISLPWLMTGYFIPVASVVLQADVSVYFSDFSMFINQMQLPFIPMMAALVLLPIAIITAMFVRFKNTDRAKEYACGEKIEYNFSSFYFSTEKATPYFVYLGVLFFVGILLAGYF